MNKQSGFSLIEILLSVATIAIIAGLSVPVYNSFQIRNDANVTVDVIAQTLRRAQILSQSVVGDSEWGVNLGTGEVTLFRGTSYAARDNTYDELFNASPNINYSGPQEIVFSKLYGIPQTTGTITITTTSNIQKTIQINSKGILTY